MSFEWDEAKNQANIQKHGIDFSDAIDVFNHPMLTLEDRSKNHGEARWIAVGWLKQLVGIVIYTERADDTIRIISARKATRHEVHYYEKALKN